MHSSDDLGDWAQRPMQAARPWSWEPLDVYGWGGTTEANAQMTCGAEVDIGFFRTVGDNETLAFGPSGVAYWQDGAIWKQSSRPLTCAELWDFAEKERLRGQA